MHRSTVACGSAGSIGLGQIGQGLTDVKYDIGPAAHNLLMMEEKSMQATRRLRQSTTPLATATGEPRIIQHPDGYYWCTDDHEVGPFANLDDARADMQAEVESDRMETGPAETVEQVEDDIGVENWIDPETGSLAEEQRPRIEEH